MQGKEQQIDKESEEQPLLNPNALLQAISPTLNAPPSWRMLIDRFLCSSVFEKSNLSFVHAVSVISEMHIRMMLESAARKYKGRVVADAISPLPDVRVGSRHEFIEADRGGMRAIDTTRLETNSMKPRTYAEYDAVALIDGLPTVVEVKITHEIPGLGLKGIPRSMNRDHIQQILEPIKDRFNTDQVAYVLVGSPRKYDQMQRKFESFGGIFVPFYTTAHSLRKKVAYVFKEHERLLTERILTDPDYRSILSHR